jgi:hypothetical protein
MNAKIALALVASLMLALVRCGGDNCSHASDHLAKCAANMTTTGASSGGMMMPPATCAGATECKAQCVNQFTCSQINGNDPAYTMCLTSCNGK